MELERMGEKTGSGTTHIMNFRKHASFLLKDGLKIVRLAFVDVSTVQLMTEDATNSEEWGPTTKIMASISDAAYVYEDYLRIVRVIRGRLALNGKKNWRQVYKALTLLEYLLTHGPIQFVVEFREDKDRIEALTRYKYMDENMVDKGSVLQKRAKHVQQLLMDEKKFKEERKRAQQISKGILGFGSRSISHNQGHDSPSSPSKIGLRRTSTSLPPKSPIVTCDTNRPCVTGDKDSSIRSINEHNVPGTVTLKAEDVVSRGTSTCMLLFDGDPSSPIFQRCTNELSWSMSPTSSVGDSPSMSSAMSSTSTDWNPFGDSPMSIGTFTSPTSPINGSWSPSKRTNLPRKIVEELEMDSTASSKRELLVKPKFTIPPPPPCGSKIGSKFGRQIPYQAQPISNLL